jgi:hypothetical protein
MSWPIALAGAVVLATPAPVQEEDAFRRAARETRLSSNDPVAVLFVSGAFGYPADSYSVYSLWDKPHGVAGRRRGYAIRKASRTVDSVRWATSSTCEALEPALLRMEAVPPPRIDLWGVGEDGGLNMVLDGVNYELWTRWPAWPGATGYSLSFSGNVNTPLAAWADSLQVDLEPCWREAPPVVG